MPDKYVMLNPGRVNCGGVRVRCVSQCGLCEH
jgi:hypothetical protein